MKRKLMTSALIIAMLAVLVAGASLAYFTDTDSATNTFTVGGVDITLTEPAWDENATHTLMPGAAFDKNPTITVAADSQDCYTFLEIDLNKYVALINLMGVDAYKEGIGGLQGTYPGFVEFCEKLVADNDLRAQVVGRWFHGINHEKWEVMNLDQLKADIEAAKTGENPKHLTIVLGYKDVMKANDQAVFMTAFGMPATVTQSMMTGDDAYKINGVSKSNFNTSESKFKMTFTAKAIQAAEIADLDAAYKALYNIQ